MDFLFGNFLGIEDEWNKSKTMTFLTKKKLLDYFKNFEIVYYAEKNILRIVQQKRINIGMYLKFMLRKNKLNL